LVELLSLTGHCGSPQNPSQAQGINPSRKLNPDFVYNLLKKQFEENKKSMSLVSGHTWELRYPCYFATPMAITETAGHGNRGSICLQSGTRASKTRS